MEVAVLQGSAEGLRATTNVDGFYRLYGVVADAELRARRSGYLEQKRSVATGHQTIDFALDLSGPRNQVSGKWTLTFSAADECRDTLPEAMMRRQYTVEFRQDGAVVVATLSGATFQTAGSQTQNTFTGRMASDQLVFQLGDGTSPIDPWEASVLERITDNPTTYFVPAGSLFLNQLGNQRSGNLVGSFTTYDSSYNRVLVCHSVGHRAELIR